MQSLRATVLLICLALLAGSAVAQTPDVRDDSFWYGTREDGTSVVRLHYFYSPTCPHCQAAKPLLDQWSLRYPWLQITRYSVKDSRENARFYYDTGRKLGVEALSVPGFVFCGRVHIGFDSAETTGVDLARALEACRAAPVAVPTMTRAPPTNGSPAPPAPAGDGTAYVPLLGRVDAQRWSLPMLTIVLAGADAFNPCAFFVLLFLLSLLVHARSRARMLIVGGTFVLFSGLVYFVFMAAWLNLFLLLGELRIVTVFAGLLALVAGGLNVKDYFAFGQGPSLSIADAAKPGLFRRMRTIVASGTVGPMLFGTILLAIVANSYELLCTAGFPMVYTRALTLAELQAWQRYAYLAAYNVIYVLPLLLIVVVFTRAMGARKLTQGEGRSLKLASGYMMLGFGALLLLAPQLLTNALASIGILAGALVLTALTLFVMRQRPMAGV